jgi:hypothetical protein
VRSALRLRRRGPAGGKVTHVLAWVPGYLIEDPSGKCSDGYWSLQKADDFDGGEPFPGGKWALGEPRDASLATLAGWAKSRLWARSLTLVSDWTSYHLLSEEQDRGPEPVYYVSRGRQPQTGCTAGETGWTYH